MGPLSSEHEVMAVPAKSGRCRTHRRGEAPSFDHSLRTDHRFNRSSPCGVGRGDKIECRHRISRYPITAGTQPSSPTDFNEPFAEVDLSNVTRDYLYAAHHVAYELANIVPAAEKATSARELLLPAFKHAHAISPRISAGHRGGSTLELMQRTHRNPYCTPQQDGYARRGGIPP